MPRASTRISIRWPPAPASEPTDTLVLEVGGYYVDLRVKKSDGSIDWALAGERIVISEDPVKVKFTKSLDSHHDPTKSEEPDPDVGEFTKLANGDDFETGEMPNPDADGKVMAYEEVWRAVEWDVPVSRSGEAKTGEMKGWALESVDQSQHEMNLPMEDFKGVRKCFYLRLGRFYLAISRTWWDDQPIFTALRQDFDSEKMDWVTKYSIGDTHDLLKMSDSTDIETDGWSLGDTVKISTDVFIVRAIV